MPHLFAWADVSTTEATVVVDSQRLWNCSDEGWAHAVRCSVQYGGGGVIGNAFVRTIIA